MKNSTLHIQTQKQSTFLTYCSDQTKALVFNTSMERGLELESSQPKSKHIFKYQILSMTSNQIDFLTHIIKERCHTGGFQESNGRQVIISSCWQRGDRGLQAGPIGRGPKTTKLPLPMQTTLHTVTQSTGPDSLPKDHRYSKEFL